MKVINKSNCCQFCQYRKELYKDQVPRECMECGFLDYRDKPYTTEVLVKKDK